MSAAVASDKTGKDPLRCAELHLSHYTLAWQTIRLKRATGLDPKQIEPRSKYM